MNLPNIGWACTTLGLREPPGLADTPLGPISIDTRTLKPGDTFWAIRSDRDGHEFVLQALSKGAKAAVVSQSWIVPEKIRDADDRLIRVPDTRLALSALGRAWRNRLSCRVIGVTGTNGKTTTKELLLRALAVGFKTAGTAGNLNNELGVPLTLLAIPSSTEYAVIEMGASHPGEIAELCRVCQPTHGLVTSIGLAHLEGFGSLAAVARTKGELYDYVSETGLSFVPMQDELCRMEASTCKRKVGYSFGARPDGWVNGFHQGESLEFDDEARGRFLYRGLLVPMSAPGYPAALAGLAALAVATECGLNPDDCISAIATWPGTRGRALVVHSGSLTILDDSYNANPSSMRAALQTLARMKAERRIAVLGDMNELGEYSEFEHRRLGEELEQFQLDAVLLVGKATKGIADAARGVRTLHFQEYDELEEALTDLIQPGDAILVKASRTLQLERAVNRLKELDR